MVIASMATQLQRLLRFVARQFESLREELILKEFIGQALVDQDAVWEWGLSISHQRTGIVSQPVLLVVTQVARERFLSPRALAGRANRRES